MAPVLRDRAWSESSSRRSRSQGASAGVPQCHHQTGYSTSDASVRRAAVAAARPAASWSGCPSRRQGAASRVPSPSPIRSTSRAATSDSDSATLPSPSATIVRAAPGATMRRASFASRSRRRPSSARGVRGRAGMAELAGREQHQVDLEAALVGGGEQTARTERLVVRVCGHDDQAAYAVERQRPAVGPPGVGRPDLGGGAGAVVGEGRAGHHGDAALTSRPSVAVSRSAWCWRR